jgi:hypothetical protein
MKRLFATALLLMLVISTVACGAAPGMAVVDDPVDRISSCLSRELPSEITEWLSTTTQEPWAGENLKDWSNEVERRVPLGIKEALNQIGRESKNAKFSEMKDLNSYHAQLLEQFNTDVAKTLHIESCGEASEVADTLYAGIVSRLGSEVRSSQPSIRARFEVSPYGKYYSGNILFVWLSLRSIKHEVSLGDLLVRYHPLPERDTIFN